jgi:hypothetical protein
VIGGTEGVVRVLELDDGVALLVAAGGVGAPLALALLADLEPVL